MLSSLWDTLPTHLCAFSRHFQSRTHSQADHAARYLRCLVTTERNFGNIERMNESVGEDDYQGLHHFISSSVWDRFPLMTQIGQELSDLFLSKSGEVSLQLDESAHLKKGKSSVGVGRQYAGLTGKVDNCQVGVYASLVKDTDFCLINSRIYLPKSWTNDPERCKKAGIPLANRSYKTKPQLALEMVKEASEAGIGFDWVGGDSIYGNSPDLIDWLDQTGTKFVLDVSSDRHLYLKEPQLVPPPKSKGRGRPAKHPKIEGTSVSLIDYAEGLDKKQWQQVKIRKTAKGWLKSWVHVVKVWVVPRKTTQIKCRTLILRKLPGRKKELKCSFSNFSIETTSMRKLVWMQGQRHFIEQSFRTAKKELGLSDYQVRKWHAWHRHSAMVMLAMLFIVKQKLVHKIRHPLTSMGDIRKLSQALIEGNHEQYQRRFMQMSKRHRKRKADIDRYYRDG